MMNEREEALAVGALSPVIRNLMPAPDDPDAGLSEDELLDFTRGLVLGLDAAGYRIREVPPLPDGAARVELIANNQFAVLGPAGKLKLGNLPEGTGPGLFAFSAGGLWQGVVLHPDTVYTLQPESRLILPS